MLPNTARKKAQVAFPILTECEHCAATERLERHHPDLNEALVILVLCKSCHVTEHMRTGTWGSVAPPCPCRICDTGEFR